MKSMGGYYTAPENRTTGLGTLGGASTPPRQRGPYITGYYRGLWPVPRGKTTQRGGPPSKGLIFRVLTLLAILVLLLTIWTTTARGSFGGYITRFNADGQYMSNQDIIVQVIAFRSSSDNKVISESVELDFTIGDVQDGVVIDLRPLMNTTIKGTSEYTNINLGHLKPGTYRITLKITFNDGETQTLGHTILVTHPPISYDLVFMDAGHTVVFNSKEKGQSFNIEIWLNYGNQAKLVDARTNITKATFHIKPGNAQSLWVKVTDRYNWTNMERLDHIYIYTVSKWDIYIKAVVFLVVWLIIAVFIYVLKKRQMDKLDPPKADPPKDGDGLGR